MLFGYYQKFHMYIPLCPRQQAVSAAVSDLFSTKKYEGRLVYYSDYFDIYIRFPDKKINFM